MSYRSQYRMHKTHAPYHPRTSHRRLSPAASPSWGPRGHWAVNTTAHVTHCAASDTNKADATILSFPWNIDRQRAEQHMWWRFRLATEEHMHCCATAKCNQVCNSWLQRFPKACNVHVLLKKILLVLSQPAATCWCIQWRCVHSRRSEAGEAGQGRRRMLTHLTRDGKSIKQ